MGAYFLNTGTVRACVMILSVIAIHLGSLFSTVNANDNASNPLQEHQTCEQIIPRFISQVMSQNSPSCEEQGAFPKPGNCSVIFKCIQTENRIQPLVEYCVSGYNFVNGVCILNSNSTDCPQYTCRIPHSANDNGNEVIDSDIDDNLNLHDAMADALQSNPSVSTETSSAASTDPYEDEQTTLQPEGPPPKKKEVQAVVHSQQFMSMTQTKERTKSGASSVFSVSLFILLPVILLID